jgi:hypothetical protein
MKPYTDDEVNAAIARVETAKQNKPQGWAFLEDMNLKPADSYVTYAFMNGQAHGSRLASLEDDSTILYSAAWLNGLAIGVALAEGRIKPLRDSRDSWRVEAMRQHDEREEE